LRQAIARIGGQHRGKRLVQPQARASSGHSQRDGAGAGIDWAIIFVMLHDRIPQ
jgi:hypothetical protein